MDRLTYARWLACVSEATRERLRYALARLDVRRTPALEPQLSAVLGQRIGTAKVHKKNPLVVQLLLEDGTRLELLAKTGSPAAGPIARTRRSVRGPLRCRCADSREATCTIGHDVGVSSPIGHELSVNLISCDR